MASLETWNPPVGEGDIGSLGGPTQIFLTRKSGPCSTPRSSEQFVLKPSVGGLGCSSGFKAGGQAEVGSKDGGLPGDSRRPCGDSAQVAMRRHGGRLAGSWSRLDATLPAGSAGGECGRNSYSS